MGFRVSFRIAATGIVVLCSAALTPIGDNAIAPGFGQPMAGLPADLLDRFNDGKAEFEGVDTVEEGVGPVFNDVSCGNCHTAAASAAGARRSNRASARSGTTGSSIRWLISGDPSSRHRGGLVAFLNSLQHGCVALSPDRGERARGGAIGRQGVRIAIPKPGQLVEPSASPHAEEWWRPRLKPPRPRARM